jgi:hypothetical protein
MTSLTTNGYMATPNISSLTTVNCYTPGVYASDPTIGAHELAVLEPGVYFFNGGLTVKGGLIGGYDGNSAGVALVVPQNKSFTLNATTILLALNRGSAYDPAYGSQQQALPAVKSDGVTNMQTNTTPPMLMSVVVPGDPGCPVVMPAPSCAKSSHSAIDWTGSGGQTVEAIAGVVYAPSDWIKVAGNNDLVRGYFGQLIAWTITYSGGSQLNQHFPGAVQPGFVRLDTACSGGNTICTP